MKEIPLTKGKVAIVDDGDHAQLASMSWRAMRSSHRRVWYARCNSGPLKGKLMHRVILGDPPSGVDHFDNNGLNNQRSNLRPATNQQNQFNARLRRDSSTGFKGVHRRENGRFTARLRRNGRQISIGVFDTSEEAARAYDRKALELGGKFALLNFPKEHYDQQL